MYKKIKTQVVVIGGGPSGYSAAFKCADLGLKTILIEKYSKLGGICLNFGCIPSKMLLNIAKVVKEIKFFNKKKIFEKINIINFSKIKEWKTYVIKKISSSLKKLAKLRNVKVIYGVGEFYDSTRIIVTSVKNNKKYLIDFNYVIIATGSRPVSILNIKNKNIWNSTDALSIPFIPKKFLIIGGGIIGLEIATIYDSFGSEIDIVEKYDKLIPLADQDVCVIFTKIMQKKFNFMFNTKVIEINFKKDLFYVTLQYKDLSLKILKYDAVLVAIGRKPNIEQLNIKKIGIKLNKNKFILVDKNMCTNIFNIYAVGDVTGNSMLAHKAMYEGSLVAEIISGNTVKYIKNIDIPNLLYTYPQVGWVGLTESLAKKNNINFKSSIFPWNASGLAIAYGYNDGITKLLFDKNSHKIIGGSVIGINAGELLGEISLAIEMQCDVEDISNLIHAHPTLYETIGLSAKIYDGSVIDLLNVNKKIDIFD